MSASDQQTYTSSSGEGEAKGHVPDEWITLECGPISYMVKKNVCGHIAG